MLELLSPAGSPEAVIAAVQSGAGAVYLGCGDFNARRNAANFTPEELAQAAAYCRVRGVKVYLTLNTLLTDRELPQAADTARMAAEAGVNAILVQDLGVAAMLRQAVPDMDLHASTQMTIHSLDGVKAAADMGLTRVVLSRELSRDQIAHICAFSPVEIEVFAHGALCMCYSGQCFFSAVIGGRSGNRGLCAQPCRLPYGWGEKAEAPLLSLKDMSLAGHLKELDEMGVTCVKLEGRMKRPEYVAIVTSIYAAAIREGREPTREEVEALERAFSRQGFTDGYFMDQTGPNMFGVREEKNKTDPLELYAKAKSEYTRGEHPLVGVTGEARVVRGKPISLTLRDDRGNEVRAEGPMPEEARNRPITAQAVEEQLTKLGGTPYRCDGMNCTVEEGLALPLSKLNALRREAAERLTQTREALPPVRTGEFVPTARRENRKEKPVFTISVREAGQLTEELLSHRPALVYLPLELAAEHPEQVELVQKYSRPAVILPRVLWDRELGKAEEQLQKVNALGVEDVLAGNWGHIPLARRLGFSLRGDYGLGITNSEALEELKKLGFRSATLSFEQRLARLRDLSKGLDTELVAYGRLPLMIMENCIVHNREGKCTCSRGQSIVDRRGVRFPVVRAWGCRNEILNSLPLFLADKEADTARAGVWALRLSFTVEEPEMCVQVMERYQNGGDWSPAELTRGLYYREVE